MFPTNILTTEKHDHKEQTTATKPKYQTKSYTFKTLHILFYPISLVKKL